jgi:hypothetical protein
MQSLRLFSKKPPDVHIFHHFHLHFGFAICIRACARDDSCAPDAKAGHRHYIFLDNPNRTMDEGMYKEIIDACRPFYLYPSSLHHHDHHPTSITSSLTPGTNQFLSSSSNSHESVGTPNVGNRGAHSSNRLVSDDDPDHIKVCTNWRAHLPDLKVFSLLLTHTHIYMHNLFSDTPPPAGLIRQHVVLFAL